MYNFFAGKLNKRKTTFIAFWSFQCVIAVVNILNIVYILKSNPKGAQAYIVTAGTICFLFVYALIFILKRNNNVRFFVRRCVKTICNRRTTGESETIEMERLNAEDDSAEHVILENEDDSVVSIDNIEVPCTGWKCCCNKKIYHMCTKNLFVFIATVNTFLGFLILVYTLPWVVLGFYSYPTKVLARLSFLIAAALCLMLNFSRSLIHIEKLALDSESHCTCRQFKKACKNIFGLVTSVVVLILLILMGGLLYHIVFVFNSDNSSRFEELLTILPGLAVSASAYVIHGKVNLADTLGLEDKPQVKYRLVKEEEFFNMIPV